jgi:hypothetical protein
MANDLYVDGMIIASRFNALAPRDDLCRRAPTAVENDQPSKISVPIRRSDTEGILHVKRPPYKIPETIFLVHGNDIIKGYCFRAEHPQKAHLAVHKIFVKSIRRG